jgi:hypothetical protein
MPVRHAGVVRPGLIQPGPGIHSRVKLYEAFIVLFRPFFPLLVRRLPSLCTTTERLGRAMLRVVQGRSDRFILESADINRIGG